MSFVFFGTPEFAAVILEKLIGAGYVPAVVVCNPDKPVGRKKVITPPPVKQRIMNYDSRIKNQIKIFQPENLNSCTLHLKSLNPDLFIVAAYAKILPKGILDIPRLGVIGIHPSLLPKYRGSSPIQSAILNGEEETGITLYLLDEKTDHGAILAKSEFPIANSDYEELMRKLADLGGDLLLETLPKFIRGEIVPLPQDESRATYTRKFKTEDAFIAFEDLAAAETGDEKKSREIGKKIRAFNPEPGAWTIKNGKRMKILKAEIKNSKLVLKKIQMEGEKMKVISNNS